VLRAAVWAVTTRSNSPATALRPLRRFDGWFWLLVRWVWAYPSKNRAGVEAALAVPEPPSSASAVDAHEGDLALDQLHQLGGIVDDVSGVCPR